MPWEQVIQKKTKTKNKTEQRQKQKHVTIWHNLPISCRNLHIWRDSPSLLYQKAQATQVIPAKSKRRKKILIHPLSPGH